MKCLHPITIRADSNPHSPVTNYLVPCGKCPHCVKRYQNSWMIRLFWEFKSHSNAVFITLTYKNQSVPTIVDTLTGECHYSLNKLHCQAWLKRLRYHVKKKFKYFLCGEYGPRSKRPHYHAIFFGLSKNDLIEPLRDWQDRFGLVNAQNVDLGTSKSLTNSSLYVSKYTNKGDFENYKVQHYGVEPSFRLMSKGIGLNYVNIQRRYHLQEHLKGNPDVTYEKRIEQMGFNSFTYVGNAVYPLPRYFKDKIFPPKTLLRTKVQMVTQKVFDGYYMSELEQLSAEMPMVEAVTYLALREIADSECSANQIIEQQSKHYDKSKL